MPLVIMKFNLCNYMVVTKLYLLSHFCFDIQLVMFTSLRKLDVAFLLCLSLFRKGPFLLKSKYVTVTPEQRTSSSCLYLKGG